jgi:hypothetical protein
LRLWKRGEPRKEFLMVVSLVLQWCPAWGEPGGVGMIVDDWSDDSLAVWVDAEEEVAALSRFPRPMADRLPPPLPSTKFCKL